MRYGTCFFGGSIVNALIGGKWREGFLDYYREVPEEYRIQVLAWENLATLRGLYFVRPRSLRVLLRYLKEVGVADASHKILRKKKIAKPATFRTMYSAIGKKIIRGKEVDSLVSIRVSSELMLALEERLKELMRQATPSPANGGGGE